MKLWSRLVSLAALPLLAATAAVAQTNYPSQPVKIIASVEPGGGGDAMVRWWANAVQQKTGQSIVVENRPGANGFLTTQTVLRSRPDGYTMSIQGTSALVGNPITMKAADYDSIEGYEPVATLNSIGFILVVPPNKGIETVQDLTKLIQSKKGEANYANANISHRMMNAWYLKLIDAKAVQVGYKTITDAVNEMLAGQVDYVFADATLGMTLASQGRVKMLATTGSKRLSFLPDLPTMAESGLPGFEHLVIWAAYMPKGTPAPVVQRMHQLLTEAASTPEAKTFFNQVGSDLSPSASPAAMKETMKEQFAVWKELVAVSGLEKQ